MQRSLSMERNGTPLCFTMFGTRIWYPIITETKYGKKDLKYIKLCIKNYFRNALQRRRYVCLELGACIP